jgi:HK97 gp10 family phage protein
MNIAIQVQGLETLQEFLTKFPVVARSELNRAIDLTIHTVQRDAIMNAPVYTGYLRANIKATFADLYGKVEADTEYASAVEFGTKPHRVPALALEKWVGRKMGLGGNEAKRVAFFIARKISQQGTKAQPYFVPAIEKNEKQIEFYFSKAVDNIINKA